jgi:hypothetical protein
LGLWSWDLEAVRKLPSPFGRGAGGEGFGEMHKWEIAFFQEPALTLTLSRRERGP